MSYRLINANNITFNSDGFITAKNIEKMPCIYADLPNGMDGEHYVLEQEPTEWQIDHEILKAYSDGADDILDKLRAEIEDLDIFYDNDYFSSNRDAMFKCSDVLQVIDKYRK